MDSPTTTHGGRREGAGRKPSIDAPVRRTVYLAQRHVDLITHRQQPGTTFSMALRALLDELLKKIGASCLDRAALTAALEQNERFATELTKLRTLIDTHNDERRECPSGDSSAGAAAAAGGVMPLTPVIGLIEYMINHGSNLNINWGEDDGCYEVDWITSGVRFHGISRSLTTALQQAIHSAEERFGLIPIHGIG
jgi:hypothetical protein